MEAKRDVAQKVVTYGTRVKLSSGLGLGMACKRITRRWGDGSAPPFSSLGEPNAKPRVQTSTVRFPEPTEFTVRFPEFALKGLSEKVPTFRARGDRTAPYRLVMRSPLHQSQPLARETCG
jgi:hypothetical protein